MNKTNNRIPGKLIISLVVLFIVGCAGPKQKAKKIIPENKKPISIVFLIGDGMGLSQISSLYVMAQESTASFSRFKHIGLIDTQSGSSKITDSAAGGTAFSCGESTYNGAIGVGMNKAHLKNIMEKTLNYSFGLVATSSITHATPAVFFAHNTNRADALGIAKQLPFSKIDFFAGGGKKFIAPIWNTFLENGFSMDSTKLGNIKGDKVGYVLADDGMPMMTEGRGSFLKDATEEALNYLEKKNKPFFLMVEGSQIDWGGHKNDANYVMEELKDFNRTINFVMDYAETHPNVLVVVTADHETGGFTLGSKKTINASGKSRNDYNVVDIKFTTTGHSASLVPVFAFGPGAEMFSGVYKNTEIHTKFMKLCE